MKVKIINGVKYLLKNCIQIVNMQFVLIYKIYKKALQNKQK